MFVTHNLLEVITQNASIGNLLREYRQLLHETAMLPGHENKRERLMKYRKAKQVLRKIHLIQASYN